MIAQKSSIYVGSINRQKFHKANCQWANYLSGSANRIEFTSREKALKAGYKSCRTCNA